VKGAFSGAVSGRKGLVAEADGGILFLDEVQDLPRSAQRLLVRVLQDRRRRYRPVGSDREAEADVELVCASNLPTRELRRRLDLDLYDRISLLTVELPPLRLCREDLADDWRRVWRELRRDEALPEDAPWSKEMERALEASDLPGNLRDLQRMATLVSAWWLESPSDALPRATAEWARDDDACAASDEFGAGTRRDRVRAYTARMARWARNRWGTWEGAADALGCDERTLREDAAQIDDGAAKGDATETHALRPRGGRPRRGPRGQAGPREPLD
jgi:DNA-binding NtrC family response regulator